MKPSLAELVAKYDSLPKEQKEEIDKLLVEDVKENPWRPLIDIENPEVATPQQMAYESRADIMLFGGAAGGGKSALLIGLALTRHQRSIIYRRESKQ